MPLKLISLLFALAALATSASGAFAQTMDPTDPSSWVRYTAPRQRSTPIYRTQLDGSTYASSNCGPAVLGMALDAYGFNMATIVLRKLTHTYQGTWPGRGGTALEHMAHVAEDYGLTTSGLYNGDGTFHKWTIDDVYEAVGDGGWVIPLVRYGMLPGHETSGVRTGHYIIVYKVEGNGFRYHDPAFRPIEEGAARWISREQLDEAMSPVLVPRQAVSIGG